MFETILLALGLGVKHSFDADHLIAVSNSLSKANSVSHSARLAASWAAGHMLTAVIVTLLLVSFKNSFFSFLFQKLDLLVALMLVLLGAASLHQAFFLHSHSHKHGNKKHSHPHVHYKKNGADHSHSHMFGIGVIHGLASNGELLLLITISLGFSSLFEVVAGVTAFSTGVFAGMILYSLLFFHSFLKARGEKLVRLINGGVGAASVLYGLMLLAGIKIL